MIKSELPDTDETKTRNKNQDRHLDIKWVPETWLRAVLQQSEIVIFVVSVCVGNCKFADWGFVYMEFSTAIQNGKRDFPSRRVGSVDVIWAHIK